MTREAADLRARPRPRRSRHAGRAADRARGGAARLSVLVAGAAASSTSVPFQMRVERVGRSCAAASVEREDALCSSRRCRCRGGRSCAAWAPAVALPFLEAMVPAFTALGQTPATPRVRRRLRSQRRHRRAVDSEDGRRRLRAPADPEAARAQYQGLARRRQQPDARASGRRRRRSRDQRGGLAERRAAPKRTRGRRRARRHHDRSGRRASRSGRTRRSRRSSSRPRTSPATSARARAATAARTRTRSRGARRPRRCRWRSTRASCSSGCSAGRARPAQRAARIDADAQHPRSRRRRRPPTCSAALGARDRARLGDYLDNVREIERRIQRTEARNGTRGHRRSTRRSACPTRSRSTSALMFDLLARRVSGAT